MDDRGPIAGKSSTKRGRTRGLLSLLPLVIPALALALYLHRLDAQSLWYDEAVSARLASMSLPDLIRWTANDIQPPLYYILLHLWTRAAGRSEWALRYLSAWWGVLVVVLGYALGRHFGRPRKAGMVAALLFLLAPWNLYYSQEARMYTMLVALGMVAVLTLSRAWATDGGAIRLGVVGLLLLYTHYFSLFLLVALSVWPLLCRADDARADFAGRDRHVLPGRHLRSLLIAWAFMFFGYLPWLPFLIRRFRVDASYWGGTLKVNEALRHWWLHMTLGAPETFLEPDALRWLPFFLALTALALLAVLIRTARGRPRAFNILLLVSLWLLLPPVLVLLLAYRSPKFNPRYLIITYPAWILLLVGAGFFPTETSLTTGTRPRVYRRIRLFSHLARALPFLVLPLFARADLAWFTDPAFTKPDFRGAIAYIREHRSPNEAILLVSGHMSPVFDYYAPDLPRVRLPDIDVLDVKRVLGFEVAREINRAIEGADGVWLLLWQDEVVDPMGIVPFLLRRAGTEDPGVPNAFWHVRVRHFLLTPGARVPETPPVEHPLRANWANTIELVGYSQYGNSVALFFRLLRPTRGDLRLHMEVQDRAGFRWGQRDTRPGPYLYPTFRWLPGKVVLGQHDLPVIPGTPAGTYALRIRIYSQAQPEGLDLLDTAGNPAGKDLLLPDIVLAATRPLTPTSTVDFPPLPARVDPHEVMSLDVPAGKGTSPLNVVGVRLWPRPPWEPGRRVYAQLRWRSSRPPRPDDDFAILLTQEGKTEETLVAGTLVASSAMREAWPADGRFFLQTRFRVPKRIAPGVWQLAVRVRPADADITSVEEVARVQIRPSGRVFEVPRVAYPVGAVFGDAIRLVGLDLDPAALRPGASVPITLTWQSIQEVERSYTAFVHLLGPDGRVIAQEDHIPGRGAFPTDAWIGGEVITDRYDIKLPDDLPGTQIVIEIGLYDAGKPGYPRLPVSGGRYTTRDAVRVPIGR